MAQAVTASAGLVDRPAGAQGEGEGAGSPSPTNGGPTWLQLGSATILVGVPLVAIGFAAVQLWDHGISLLDAALAAALYVVSAIGVTVGFHRHLTHGSFKACRPLRLALLIAGSLSVQGDVIAWVSHHRRHHAFSDREGDPHSPARYGGGPWAAVRGFVFAQWGWFFVSTPADSRRWAPDLLADRDVRFVARLTPVWFSLSIAVPFLAGWLIGGSVGDGLLAMLWAGFIRIWLLHQVTFATNSVCHMVGRRPFITNDRSRNVASLAVLSFGESWHNAHHAFPAMARHGVGRGEVDLSAGLIRVFEMLHLVSAVRWPSAERLDSKRRSAADPAVAAAVAAAVAGPER